MMIYKDNLKILVYLILIKVLYMLSISLMLPDKYELWSYNKNVDWFYFVIELLVLIAVYILAFRHFDWDSMYALVILIIFVMAYIPANSGLSLSGQDVLYYVCVNIYFALLFAVLDSLEKHLQDEDEYNTFEEQSILFDNRKLLLLRIFMLVICGITIYFVYQYNGLNFNILNSVMYDTRANYAEYIASRQGTFISYFALILMGITTWMLPLYLYLSLYYGKALDIIIALFTFLALYLMEMQKSTLMVIPLVLLILLCTKKKNRKGICFYVLNFFVLLFVAIFVEYFIRKGTSSIFNFLIPRMFYMPTYLSKIYYDYFSVNHKMWFTQDVFIVSNILSRLIGRFGSDSIVGTISNSFFKGLIPSPNTGFFAEAFAQVGYFGIVIFPLILGALTKLIYKTSKWYGEGVELTLGARWALLLLNTQVLTSTRMVSILMFVLITFFLVKTTNSHMPERSVENG